MAVLFDPLLWLAGKGVTPYIALDGSLRLRFGDKPPRFAERENIRFRVAPYVALLRLQLDVPEGDRPRTVRQLLAVGRIVVKNRRYMLAG